MFVINVGVKDAEHFYSDVGRYFSQENTDEKHDFIIYFNFVIDSQFIKKNIIEGNIIFLFGKSLMRMILSGSPTEHTIEYKIKPVTSHIQSKDW